MNVLQVYDHFSLISGLRLHQLRVAHVISELFDRLHQKVVFANTKQTLVLFGLVHDLGNMIKALDHATIAGQTMDLTETAIAREIKNRYGSTADEATKAMLRELKAPTKIIELLDCLNVNRIDRLLESGNWAGYVCQYADLRVMPTGIVSLDERLDDLFVRYASQFEDKKSEIWDRTHRLEQTILQKIGLTSLTIAEPTQLQQRLLLEQELGD